MSVAVGSAHALALTIDQELYSWGCGSYGALGFGAKEDVETPINFIIEDGDSEREFYITLYDDWSGIDVEVDSLYDNYGVADEYMDTSYFDWSATSDSLFLYYDDDTMNLEYMINQDTLMIHAFFDPCEQDGYETYEECFDDMDLPGFEELVEINNFRFVSGFHKTGKSQ